MFHPALLYQLRLVDFVVFFGNRPRDAEALPNRNETNFTKQEPRYKCCHP